MDAESFKKQFLPFHPRLYRIAFAILGNSENAEDVLQDAYRKLWEKRKKLILVKNPEAYCVTLIKNICFDQIRSARRSTAGDKIDNIAAICENSPENDIMNREELLQIGELINGLPDNLKQVIRLRAFEDRSFEEIEKITGLSTINIRVMLSRARKLIRKQYNNISSYER